MLDIVKQLEEFMGRNQFASGGLLLVIVGAVLAYLRRIPSLIYYYYLRWTTVVLEVDNEHNFYDQLDSWMASHNKFKKCRNIFVKDHKEKPVPNIGVHYFLYGWHPVIMWKERREKGSNYQDKELKLTTLRFLFANVHTVEAFLKEVSAFVDKDNLKRIAYYNFTPSHGWRWFATKLKRPESTFIGDTVKKDLFGDLDLFMKSRDRYIDLGINYKRVYLLCGPPGNGKTSLAHIVASRYNREVRIVNLSGKFSDTNATQICAECDNKSVMLLEEIDKVNWDPKAKNSVPLNVILGLFDGVYTPDNLIIIATCNDKSKLSEILLRPGRIDKEIYIPNPIVGEIRQLYKKFYPGYSELEFERFITKYPVGNPMSYYQEKLINETGVLCAA